MADKNDQSHNKQPKVRSQQNHQGFSIKKEQNKDQQNDIIGNVKSIT